MTTGDVMTCHVHTWCVLEEHDPPQQHVSRDYTLRPSADGAALTVTRVAYADDGPVYLCLQVQQHEVDKDWTLLTAQEAKELTGLLLNLAQGDAEVGNVSITGQSLSNPYPSPRNGTRPS